MGYDPTNKGTNRWLQVNWLSLNFFLLKLIKKKSPPISEKYVKYTTNQQRIHEMPPIGLGKIGILIDYAPNTPFYTLLRLVVIDNRLE